MKVLALNSSPRSTNESYTVMMLNKLIEGMRDAGADVEAVNLREKKIKNCIGCYSCWSKTPGQCILKDDMTSELYPRWLGSDMVVYASPLYFHTLNSAMSRFIERTLPVGQPFLEQDKNGKTYHPRRHKLPVAVILSVCGFPELSEFDAMIDFMTRTNHYEAPPLTFICRPGASSLSNPFLQKQAGDVLDAVKQAGRELVKDMKIAPRTMKRITQTLEDTRTFTLMGNMFWKTLIEEGITPKEFEDRKMLPRPYTLEDFMFMMPHALKADAVSNKKVILQFVFSGKVNDSCHFIIDKGQVKAKPGKNKQASLTIETPFNVWMDIMAGKADGAQMFTEQKYTVHGDIPLMLQLLSRE